MTTIESLLVEHLGAERVRADEPLARHTFYRIGGPAELFVSVESVEELAAVAALARENGLPCFILGAGSNILVSDAGMRGLVIKNRAGAVTWAEEDGEALLRAESGALLSKLARQAARRGWGGLTWACGIPGTVGGAVVQNAGAHDKSMAGVLAGVSVLDEHNAVRDIPTPKLELGYRSSILRQREWIVLSAAMCLRRGKQTELESLASEYDAQRRAKQPQGASCGSVFKNPPGDYAGRLIEAAGLKGKRAGGAEISPQHANFIVNTGTATAGDVMALINLARREVGLQFGVTLELEIQVVGEW